MRVFQFGACYQEYLADFEARVGRGGFASYSGRLGALLADRFNGVHILEPVLAGDPAARYTVANDRELQLQWAREHGLGSTDLTDILLAQIEEHRADVVYSLYPAKFDSGFVRRLPGSVRASVCFLASSPGRADLTAYTLRVSNFPNFLEQWALRGERAAYLSPALDPAMGDATDGCERTIDVCFAGTYSPLHKRRNRLLEAIAGLAERHRVVMALLHPPHRPLVNLPLVRRIPGPLPVLPRALREVAVPAVYGRELYRLLGSAKVVFNGSCEVAETFRGNMRCFEAMGCGACMVSDEGTYPDGMVPGEHFVTYRTADEAVRVIESLLEDGEAAMRIGRAGRKNLADTFSKGAQWRAFCALVGAL